MSEILLWSSEISSTENGTDLTEAGPITTPNNVTVDNSEDSEATVYLACSNNEIGAQWGLPPDRGTNANHVALRPGQRSPLISIPSGYTLYANVATDDKATVMIWQES